MNAKSPQNKTWTLLSLPVHFAKIFTWDKSFKKNPIIGSPLLNRLGLHVVRVVVAHLLFSFRLSLLSPFVSAEQRRFFRKHGYLKIENFLPAQRFEQLAEEIREYDGEIREEIEGSTITQRLYLTKETLSILPECTAFTKEKPLLRLLRYASSKNRIPFFHLENIVHHASPSKRHDPQKDFHTDTFHPCIKAWLYIDDVSENNGPFHLVPGSHRLTKNRLRWEYQQSLIASRKASEKPKGHYWDGSFRVSDADIEALGYGKPVAMTVPANTLLIANVHAIHRRGDAKAGASRMTVWMQARDNPFNPLFSPFPQTTASIFEWFWKIYMAQRTRKQIKAGAWRTKNGGFTTPNRGSNAFSSATPDQPQGNA